MPRIGNKTPNQVNAACDALGSVEKPLVSAPMRNNCRFIVVVPVRNEERFVRRALTALARQTVSAEEYEIFVLLNNCTDGSAREVSAFSSAHTNVAVHSVSRELPPHNANIGYVRRLLMDESCRRLLTFGQLRGAILSTDADTVVRPNWIELNRQVLDQGWDAVGGRILLDQQERRQLPREVQRRYLLDITYNLLNTRLKALLQPDESDPWPSHHQHFAASLAVTADAYLRAGGIPRVRHLEDVALWNALANSGARLRHSPEIVVTTSARMAGRADVGLSSHLSGFERDAEPMVECAETLAARYKFTVAPLSATFQPLSQAVQGLRAMLRLMQPVSSGFRHSWPAKHRTGLRVSGQNTTTQSKELLCRARVNPLSVPKSLAAS